MGNLKMLATAYVFALVFSAIPALAHAQTYESTAKVTNIQVFGPNAAVGNLTNPSTAGNALFIMFDADVGACPGSGCCLANTNQILYSPMQYGNNDPSTDVINATRQLAQTKAVLSSLQLSLALGTRVKVAVYAKSPSGYCQLSQLQSLNN